MSDSKDPRLYYYSTYHFARDLIGTAAPFTFFFVLTAFLFQPVRDFATETAYKVASAPSWLAVAGAGAIFFLVAFASGMLANRAALAVVDLFKGRFGIRRRNTYSNLCEPSRAAIEELYDRYIIKPHAFWTDADYALPESLSRLCHYFKLHNPSGFQHLYRDYSFVFIYRQAAVYTLLLLVICIAQGRLVESLALSVAMLGVLLSIRAGSREVVNAAYNFILSTASWLEYTRGGSGEAPEASEPNPSLQRTPGLAPKRR